MKRALVFAALLPAFAACAAASGYDPKRYAPADAGPVDPNTTALPAAPRTTIPDPKLDVAPLSDASTPDAGAARAP